MTLEGCAHVFEGCSQIMLIDCSWMMLEAEKIMLQGYSQRVQEGCAWMMFKAVNR